MSVVSKTQVRILRRQIGNVYSRNYIPLTMATTTLSVGDVLRKIRDTHPDLDSSLLGLTNDDLITGTKVNRQFMTTSSVSVSFKAAGSVSTPPVSLPVAKAGLIVELGGESSMFLKVLGLHEQSIKDFDALRRKVLESYVSGAISARVFVVRGLLMADRFYLQFGGTNGGKVGLEIDAGVDMSMADAKLDASFKVAWTQSVGFDVDAVHGGPLGYRVSAVRARRQARTDQMTASILKGATEAEALDDLPLGERLALAEKDAFEVEDCTDAVICELEA